MYPLGNRTMNLGYETFPSRIRGIVPEITSKPGVDFHSPFPQYEGVGGNRHEIFWEEF